MSWKDLPASAFKIIFENTNSKAFRRCLTVCKSWNDSIQEGLFTIVEFKSKGFFTDMEADMIERFMPNIQILKITLGKEESKNFTPDAFFKLWSLRNLQQLEIDFSGRKFKNPRWFSYSAIIFNFNLEVFKIANVEIELQFLEVLTSRAPNIQEICLNSIPNLSNITRGIQKMAVGLRMLRRIEFMNLCSSEDFELNYMFPIPEFNHLNEFYSENVDFPCSFFKMFKASTLQKVIFNFCHTICSKDVEELTKRCPNIEVFKMKVRYDCPHFTDSIVEVLSLNLHNLRVVEFDCRGTTLSYRSIRFLLKNAAKLEVAIFNNLEGFETTEEIEGFLEEASKLRSPYLTIERTKLEDPDSSLFMETEYELRSDNLKVVIRSLICDISLNKSLSSTGSLIMDVEESLKEMDSFRDMSTDGVIPEEVSPAENYLDSYGEEYQYKQAFLRRTKFLSSFDEYSDYPKDFVQYLPSNVFEALFSNFSYRQLKVLMLVCKDWCSEIKKYLQDKLWLNCSRIISPTDLLHLNRSDRIFQKLKIETFTPNLQNILRIIDLSKVTALIFEGFEDFEEILNRTPQLEFLNIYHFGENFPGSSSISNVRSLKTLVFNSALLVGKIPTLELLVKNNPMLVELELILPKTSLNLAFLHTLPFLKRFTLHQLEWNDWFLFLTNSLRYLTINITQNNVRGPKIPHFFNKFNELEELSLNFLNKKRFDIVWKMKSIRKMVISGVKSPFSLWGSDPQVNSELVSLTLSCTTVTDNFFGCISSASPNLECLSLSTEKQSKISSALLSELISKLNRLSTLELSNFGISVSGKHRFDIENTPISGLKSLVLYECEYRVDFLKFLNAPGLEQLMLDFCERIDLGKVQLLGDLFPMLKTIQFCNISSLVLFATYGRFKLLENFYGIVSLDAGMPDLMQIFSMSTRIKHFDLELIGNFGLESFAKMLETIVSDKNVELYQNMNNFEICDDDRKLKIKYVDRR